MMQKVVLLIRNAAKSDFGGAETYQISIAKILAELGYSPIVITRSSKLLNYADQHSVKSAKGWWWSRQNWSGKNVILIPFYYLWQAALTVWYLRIIQKTGASILHIQSKDDFIAASIAGRILKKRVIWSDHMDLRYILKNLTSPFKNPVGKLVYWSMRFSDTIILISDNEHRLVTSHFKKNDSFSDTITIVKNGVIDQYKALQTHLRTPVVFTFCLASRIVTNKGIGEAIDAYMSLEKSLASDIPTKLAIYGDGADITLFKDRASKSQTVEFYGHQDKAIEKIAESTVFILPSYQEGFSLALLEATMLGKAIIATDVDSNSEIIIDGYTGLLVKVRDPKSLEDAMRLLLTDPILKKTLEENARKSYEENFDLSKSVEMQILPLYER